MLKRQIVHRVRYGFTTLFLFIIISANMCSNITLDIFTPYSYIIDCILLIFTVYFCSYKRYKLNPLATEVSFIRQVIIDPTAMILSIPFLFVMMRRGFGDLSVAIFLGFGAYPYLLTNKRLSGHPEKRWSELNTRFEKTMYGIGYFIMALLAFVAIVSFINRIREIINITI